jgi:hypothetical protein
MAMEGGGFSWETAFYYRLTGTAAAEVALLIEIALMPQTQTPGFKDRRVSYGRRNFLTTPIN